MVRYELKSGIPGCSSGGGHSGAAGGGEAAFRGFLVAGALDTAVLTAAAFVAFTVFAAFTALTAFARVAFVGVGVRRAPAAGAEDVLKLRVWVRTGDGGLMGRVGDNSGSDMDLVTLRQARSVRESSPTDDAIECVGESDRRGEVGPRDNSGDKDDNGRTGDNGDEGDIERSLSVVFGIGTGEDDSVRSIVTYFGWEGTTGSACSCS